MVSHWEPANDRVRHDLLYRLRWNLLDDLAHIKIVTELDNKEIVAPLLSHPLAEECPFSPPVSRLELWIDECCQKNLYDKAPEEYHCQPPPLLIDNTDGQHITLRDFVTQVHAYMNQHMEEIKKVKGGIYGEPSATQYGSRTITCGRPYLPPNIGIFFKRAYASARNDDVRLSVALFAEGELWVSLDQFWVNQMNQARIRY